MQHKPARLITVVREDLSYGYQIAQTAHAVANFAYEQPDVFALWHEQGNYMISLAVPGLKELELLMEILQREKVGFVPFFESDVNEITAIAICPCNKANELTKELKLAGRKAGSKDKHH